jgi:protein phosphatase
VAPDALRVVELAQRSDTGRVRDHNEDRSYATPAVVAVADGMGGALAGEVAAQIAVAAVERVGTGADRGRLRAALEDANRDIRRLAAQDAGKAGMGTTMTAASVHDGRADIVHVGDSRAYLWRDGGLLRLTEDHSVVGELLRRGTISQEEADHHPHRNVITRALGAEPQVQVDVVTQELADGDVLLLCSDGLYGEVGEPEIAGELARAGSLEEAAAALVAMANGAGGHDNVTVVLARIGHGEEAAAVAAEVAPATTQEHPVVDGPDRRRTVIGGVRSSHPEGAAPSAPPRVLERAGARRRRRGPLVAALAVALALIAGGTAWAVSRAYTLEEGPDGTVRVERGLALGPLDLTSGWQGTGVPAAEVAAGAHAADVGDVGGQGATVLRAVRIVWGDGLADPPALVPVEPPAPAPARRAAGGTTTTGGAP